MTEQLCLKLILMHDYAQTEKAIYRGHTGLNAQLVIHLFTEMRPSTIIDRLKVIVRECEMNEL